MQRKDPIYESATGTADGSGIATARIGPRRAFERWEVRSVSLQNTSTNLTPKASIYRAFVGPSSFINGTYSGNFDTDSDFNQELQSGEDLIVQWEGCDPGSISTVILQGIRTSG
jgi:hypothetical protein